MPDGSEGSPSETIRIDILRVLLQEGVERPDALSIEDLYSQVRQYPVDDFKTAIDWMGRNLDSPLEYETTDCNYVCVDDLRWASSRINELLDQEDDPFRLG